MALHGQEAPSVDLSIPASSGFEPSRPSDSSPSPVLNLLSSLSRNTSVISSSSSSSSSSSIVLAPPRPLRSFSGQSHGSRSPHNGNRTRRPHSPPSPRTPRPPNYLQRQLGLADPPEVALPPPVLPGPSGVPTLVPNIAPAHPPPTRIVSNNAVKRPYSADDFEFGDVLGEGSYSTVLSVTHRRTGQVFALKVLDKHHLQRVNKVKYAYVEKDTLAKLSNAGHPGVVKLHWAFSDTSSLYFVLDKVNNGELMTKINLLGSLSIDCSRYYAAQMVDTVSWMHDLGVLHRDMKPENVLLDDNMRIKITDFGTAKILDENASSGGTSSFVGSPGYISPELLISSTCGKSADFWAIGCILFQMISGAQPFKALTSYLSMEKTRKAEYAFPEGFDPIARDLVENLLVLDPAGRLGDAARGGVSALRAHPFFALIDWGTLWTSPAPVLKAGLVERETEQEQRGIDEDHEGNATDVGAAWNALVRDLSEDEMGGPDDEDEQATIGDPSERLPQADESTLLRFPSDDKDGASFEDQGTADLISGHEVPMGAPVVPESPPLASQSTSLVLSDGAGSDASTKWGPFLQSGEKVIFSSAIRARRRGILPARLKPRVLVLTDQPRFLCFKTVTPGVDGGVNERLKIKSELSFEPPRLSSPASWSARVGPILEAGGSSAAGESAMRLAMLSTSVPTTSTIAERSRTLSSSTGISRRGRSVQRRDANVLRSVELKGDRSFVVQTARKRYTFLADDQILASNWVQKIKSAMSSRSGPNGPA